MTRPLRIQYPGAYLHIMSRGNARQDIFRTDSDRRCWLRTLDEVLSQFNWTCFTYVLMDNHYHLFVQIHEENLSEGMRELNGLYTQRFNKKHGRIGHLFQDRYKSQLVDREAYFLELIRYIILNPVRAKMTSSIEEWQWSSYIQMSGYGSSRPKIATDQILELFEMNTSSFEKYLNEGVDRVIELPNVTNGILGSEMFVEHVSKGNMMSDDRFHTIAERSGGRPTLEELFCGYRDIVERNEIVDFARKVCKYSVQEIASHLKLHPSSVSRIIHRCKK